MFAVHTVILPCSMSFEPFNFDRTAVHKGTLRMAGLRGAPSRAGSLRISGWSGGNQFLLSGTL